MIRGWTIDKSLYSTLNLVMAAVGLEIIRFTFRIGCRRICILQRN